MAKTYRIYARTLTQILNTNTINNKNTTTNMKTILRYFYLATILWFVSCINDLNTLPIDPDVETSETVYGSEESYLQGLAKLYSAFSLQGQYGGDGGEIDGVDGGLSVFARALWNTQELPTDAAIVAWKDDDYLHGLNFLNWSTTENKVISGAYYRITYTVTLINEYLRQTTTEKLEDRGTSSELMAKIEGYRYQARVLRALVWSYGVDLFGNMPFVDENDPIGVFYPEQYTREQLFNYVESELLAVESYISAPKSVEFGYLDQGLVWGLLSRLYLNAEIYTGTARYTDAITYANKVIQSGVYSLAPNYAELFMANNNNTNADVWAEMIFTGIYDNNYAQAWGGTTFVVAGSRGENPQQHGALEGWSGIRAREELAKLFPDYLVQDSLGYVASPDGRCIMYSEGRTLEATDPWEFTNGYSVYKWSALNSNGEFPTGNQNFVATDWVYMRYAEILLNYTEAVVRGGTGGDLTTAVGYINTLRERAYSDTSGNITSSDLSLSFLIDERGRELYWEGFRRTDLIRFGLFTGNSYLWDWKGQVLGGATVNTRYNLYPIPYTDLVANPNLTQNAGY